MSSARFVQFSDAELEELKKKKVAKNTTSGTKNGLITLTKFCKETGFYDPTKLQEIDAKQLNTLLCRFYAGCRTEKGELYKVNSLNSLRSGLQRYFQQVQNVDIVNNDAFNECNSVLQNVFVRVKSSAKGQVSHYPEIEPEDLVKLYDSYDINTPVGLQEKVWLDVMIFFVRRGRENLRSMTKNSFSLDVDASGKRFISQVTGEVDKNHPVSGDQFETIGEGRMYETGKPSCPVKSFLDYLSHLNPKQDTLWQRPKEKFFPTETIWYDNAPLGEKTLGQMLAKMSTKYSLSQRYTNHSLRVTSLQALEDANVEGRHAIRISGHKSTESLKNYARTLSAARKRKISSILSNAVDKENLPPQSVPASSSNTTESVSSISNESFDLDDDIDFFAEISGDILTNNAKKIINKRLSNQFAPVFNNCTVNMTININK